MTGRRIGWGIALLLAGGCAAPLIDGGGMEASSTGKADCGGDDACPQVELPSELCSFEYEGIVERHANRWFAAGASPELDAELADALRVDLAEAGLEGELSVGWKREDGQHMAFVGRAGFVVVYVLEEISEPHFGSSLVVFESAITRGDERHACTAEMRA